MSTTLVHAITTLLAAAPVVPDPGAATPAAAPATPAATSVDFPDVYLTMMVWGTALFSLVVVMLPERTAIQRGRIRTAAMFATGTTFLLALFGFNSEISNDLQGGLPSAHDERRGWLTGAGIHADYHLTADGITLALLLLTSLLFVVAVIASFKVEKHIRLYFALLLLVETGVSGVLLANDLLLFVVFWGTIIVPLYILMARWGGAGAAGAARRYLHHALAGLALLSAGIVLIGAVADQGAFDLEQVAGTNMPYGFSVVAFFLVFAGLAVSMGAFPFHGWLAEAEAEANAPVAVIIAGALVTVAGYGMVRILLQVLGPASTRFSFFVVVVGLLTTGYGAFSTIRQRDLRRAVSHFSLALNGLVLVAVGCHSTTGMVGVVTLLVANGLAVAVLHLSAGAVEARTRTGRLDRLGGMATQLPRISAFWMVAVLSALGAPFFAGFVGLFLVITGSFPVHRVATAAVLVLLFVAAAGIVRVTQRVFLGPVPEGYERATDIDANELWQLIPLAVGIFLWGILPGRALPMVTNGVVQTVARHIGGT